MNTKRASKQKRPGQFAEAHGSATETLVDLIEDPNNNGDYRLSISGDELTRLWRAVESAQNDALRLARLESHLLSGRSVSAYMSTEGPCFKLADKYNYGVPYHRTLAAAIDTKSPNDPSSPTRNEMTTRTDTQLLDALESVPWAIEIKCVQGQPKCDSLPSLREQIGRFLDERAQFEPPND
jgi:hypothetical protein